MKSKKASAKFVPAAAVKRMKPVLLIFNGRKGRARLLNEYSGKVETLRFLFRFLLFN